MGFTGERGPSELFHFYRIPIQTITFFCYFSVLFFFLPFFSRRTIHPHSPFNARYGYGTTFNTPYYGTWPAARYAGYPTAGRVW